MFERGIIGKRIASYRIDKLLGQGGMAAVYQATDTSLNRQVAIKLMHAHLATQAAFQTRFLQEADAISRLNHPNIIKILGFDRVNNDLFIVMELIAGGNLRTYVKHLSEEARLMPLPDVVELSHQLASALDYAHKQGMIHRDIKPDNVLLRQVSSIVSRTGIQPVLTDFGLVRLTGTAAPASDPVPTDLPLGTYPYMSPEQCLGESIDIRTDIYSLGVMLYELSAGRLPFMPRNLPEAARMHGSEPVIPPSSYRPEVDPLLETIILKCLAKEPGDRYQTAGELADELGDMLPADTGHSEDFEPGDLATDTGATHQMPVPIPAEKPFYNPPAPDRQDADADRLICYSADHPVIIVTLRDGGYTIGTADDQTIRLAGNRVSRRHARLERVDGKYRITDSGSINGTWVGNARLNGGRSAAVVPGQLMRVGDYWMWIEEAAAGERAEDIATDHGTEAPVTAAVIQPPASPAPEPVTPAATATLHTEPALEQTAPPADFAAETGEVPPPAPVSESPEELPSAPPSMPFERDIVPAPPPEEIKAEEISSGDVLPPPADAIIPAAPVPPAPPPEPVQKEETGQRTPTSSTSRRAATPPRSGSGRVPPRQVRVPPGKKAPEPPPQPVEDELPPEEELVKTPPPDSRPAPSPAASSRPKPSAPPPDDDDMPIDKTMMNFDAPEAAPPKEPERGMGGMSIPDGSAMVGKPIGTYRLMKFIQQNPVAAVFEAWDTRRNRAIALKLLHQPLSAQEPLRRRFLEEARAAANLDHPNIVKIYSYETAEPYTFLTMELIQGGSLRGYVRRLRNAGRSLDYPEILSMMREMADGLHYAHQQGMLHRDIKPDNIVLREATEAGQTVYHPILTDFGLAQLGEGGDVFSTDQPAITYPYMSPEECLGQRLDARSDIYEIGTLMYEVTVGQVPFQPRSMAEAIRMHTREPVPRPSGIRTDIPAEMERIILKCLEKEPNNRFLTAAELSRALQNMAGALAAGHPGEAEHSEDEILETQTMAALIAEQMPSYPPQPVTDEQVGFERLIVTSDSYPPAAYAMNKNILTIGRAEDQTVRLDSTVVSRRHARIERGFNNTYRIIDLGSANGTYLGSKKLTPNVAEVWSADKTLRIGEYWFRLEPAATRKVEPRQRPPSPGGGVPQPAPAAPIPMGRHAVAPMTNLDATGDYSAEELAAAGVIVATAPPPRVALPPAEHDKISLKIANPVVTVSPGSSTTIQVEVQNLSSLVDHFVITAVGLPEGWYTVQQAPIYLLPNNRETATITLHPPLASSTTEGAHYFEVRAIARAQNIFSVAVQCAMNVLPFKNFVANLEPRRVTARGRPEVTITNTGNTFATFTVQPRDREQALQFEVSGKQFTLGPGQSEFVGLRLKARERPFLGGEKIIPFEVMVSAGDEKVPPQTLPGEMAVRARFPLWILSFLMLLLALCVIISLFTYSQVVTIINNNMTLTKEQIVVTTQAHVTLQAVHATATANADPDNDGLTTFQELALGLKPDDPDSDTDGLIDGDEVRIWNTNPLNPDTDGDGVKDGVEVKDLGTDPLKPDSDNDTIPDNEDNAPTIKSTPTITPFPTIPGTEGDICAGSPAARMQIGMDAQVEPGGVNNRLRDNPGVSAGQVIGLMAPSTGFRVLEGPVCDTEEQLRWWKVDYNGVIGWTAEGRGTEYFICPPDVCGQAAAGGGGGGAAGGGGGGTAGAGTGGGATAGSLPPNPDVVAGIDTVLQGLVQPPSAIGLDRTRMGVQLFKSLDTGSWQVALDKTGSLGVGWIKVQLNWAAAQPDGPGQLSSVYNTFEANIQAADARGFRILVSIAKAPTWARNVQGPDSGPPDDPQALADFLTLILPRIGPMVDAIEVWNEPNLIREWSPGPLPFSGAGYMQLFQPAYQAIRNYSPIMTIVTAGLAPTGSTGGSVNDRAYMQQMYAAGLANFKDIVVGIHPYSWGNPPNIRCCNAVQDEGWDDDRSFFFLNNIEDYRTIMLANGHDVQMWITEFGWASWTDFSGAPPEPWIAYNSLTDQANFTIQAFQIGQRLTYIGPMFLWNLNFASTAAVQAGDAAAAYSLLVNDVSVRPVYGSLVAPPSQ